MDSFQFLGLTFNTANIISITIAFAIVFFVVFFLSRKITMKPTGGQNILEWIIDFTNGIVRGQLPGRDGGQLGLFAFTAFLFVFFANQLGLFLQVSVNGVDYVRSPTANPVVTLTMAMVTLALAHYLGVVKFGFGGYISNSYLKPFAALLPINLVEEFTNLLTLALRLYGNIFAGETLLKLIGGMAFSHGLPTIIVALPLEIVWQGFSVFIGAIQAYVFVTLSTVYISRKVTVEE
ncbi:F0F1 ATP synthase subunit A [Furfurilactobacillus rossiae]|uniref:ATP synthase subunit a n=1 Tax=Furfurilactobacillus rossiae DSM 15814 TaxID=1114972 RepID=A0A0R1RC41_9LACO|nr:F0F1 ATP synthase subunit A [Furfurilactobacillus rossiae]KRL54225.1 H(+)-transporting ATPase F(0) A subunit [Furfurilactobacillus rossiae DSM 15814]MCF6166409.1 F0F1 ATP synthase subunit A [Furfurilactobacillus rossiae]QFR66376.1 F0F1 ATP synthase subunit A [Furfurilactobacillus rossiae]QLE61830.1 ATP synthase A chain [Furfurilactobacillus rossiae]QLE64632.1 ATP synthase A chain [Furfurilactobacillus rossiae]